MSNQIRKTVQILLIVVLIMLLGACANAAQNDGDHLPVDSPTTVPLPSETPTPIPGVVVLSYSPEINSYLVEEARSSLQEQAAASAMTFTEAPSLQPGEVQENWKIVVLLNTPANINELAASAPQTQFVVVSNSDVSPAANLSVIRQKPENQAFIAGYVTLMIAGDWRAGALFSDDPVLSPLQTDAFVNGGHYICGRCTSVWMPVKAFPLLAQMPAGSNVAAWQNAVNEMKLNVIYVMYVAPEVATPELLTDLASGGLMLVGGAPPPDEVRSVWAGTVRFDTLTPLKAMWQGLLAGQGGQTLDADIQFTDVNTQYFSQGRGRLAQLAAKDLLEGAINPLTPPMQ